MDNDIDVELTNRRFTLMELLIAVVSLPVVFMFVLEISWQGILLNFRLTDAMPTSLQLFLVEQCCLPPLYIMLGFDHLFGWIGLGFFFVLWGYLQTREAKSTATIVAITLPFVEYFQLCPGSNVHILRNWSVHLLPSTALLISYVFFRIGTMVGTDSRSTVRTRFGHYVLYCSWGAMLVFGCFGANTFRRLLEFHLF